MGLSARARPKRRRHLARHRLFRKCAVGVLYPVAGVRPRNVPAQLKQGIGNEYGSDMSEVRYGNMPLAGWNNVQELRLRAR